jgi:hypothetical protein
MINEISLSQALKVKNRLVGEIAKLRRIITRENSRRSDNPSKVDVAAKIDELNVKYGKLVDIKTKIATANVGIYREIAQMEETKGNIAFFSGIPTREGEEMVATYGQQKALEYQHVAYLNQEGVDTLVSGLQKLADELQDKIDRFNANTFIKWEN